VTLNSTHANSSVQAIVHVEEELFEAQRSQRRLGFRDELDHVVLGLHATMDARTRAIV
jgi:hypothetical protein